MDSKQLLYDIRELRTLFKETTSIETMLAKAVDMVAAYTRSSVCSIYVYNEEDRMLTLRASRGLNPESVGRVRLGLGQGLTGLALQEMRIICEADASRNPNYRFFPDIFEERYNAFLAVPIARGLARMGVMVLQRDSSEAFTAADITALQTVASQLANIIENAQVLLEIHDRTAARATPFPAELKIVKGKVCVSGFAHGQALVINRQRSLSALRSGEIGDPYSVAEFRAAVTRTAEQLESLQEQVEDRLSDAASLIFAAHLMILKDRFFLDRVEERITHGTHAPHAIADVADEFIQGFRASGSVHTQEKAIDIEDLALRLVNNLTHHQDEQEIYRGRVVITQALFPSHLLMLASEAACAVIQVGGGVTTHISILARSLEMPMLVSDAYELLDLADGTPILVDAENGNVFIDPDEEVTRQFQAEQATRLSLKEQKARMRPHTVTADGTEVKLLANINLLSDLELANELFTDGVGLYRTEFPYIIRTTFPTEEEQFVTYSKLVQAVPAKLVTFRTLDAGGDKTLSYFHDRQEQNPAMGMRSTRFTLKYRTIFSGQVRAILRASAEANLRLMFPMISSVDEFCQAREVVHESIEELTRRGIAHNDRPQLGMMVELPSVVDLIEAFAEEVDFFSIGTNDFIQFMLGVDRTNESVADFYLPHHPSVLRGLNRIVTTAVQYEREISICGDMAHDPRYIPFLLGIGIRAFSVDPAYLLSTQKTILGTALPEAQTLAGTLLSLNRIPDIEAVLRERVPTQPVVNDLQKKD